MFDVTRATTYEAVEKWKMDLDSKVFLSDDSPIPAVLLANKVSEPSSTTVRDQCYILRKYISEFCV